MTFEIIPRSAWGARHDDGFGPAPIPAPECWLHHSVTLAPDLLPPYDDDYAAVRTLEQIGENRFGGGISYTWIITPAGLIFQGHSPWRQGAHTANRNDRARAICFIGNYENMAPTTAQLRAAAWLLQHAKSRGWLMYARLNGGHRDVGQTACPGQHAYARIGIINNLAAGPPVTPLEDDLQADEREWLRQIYSVAAQAYIRTGRTLGDLLADVAYSVGVVEGKVTGIDSKVDSVNAQVGDLADDEANVVTTIRELQLGQVDVDTLAAKLVPLLPPETTADQVAEAVANEFARRQAE